MHLFVKQSGVSRLQEDQPSDSVEAAWDAGQKLTVLLGDHHTGPLRVTECEGAFTILNVLSLINKIPFILLSF